MKKLLFAAAAVALVAASDARADFGTPSGAPQAPAAGGEGPVDTKCHYGWNPVFKKLLWWKKDTCSTGDCGKGKLGGKANCAGQGPVAPPPYMGGTLVFPNHQFNRSPRDYFMYGQGGN